MFTAKATRKKIVPESKEEILIEAKDLIIGNPKNPILKDVNFTLKSNQILTIVGPNGGGKTMLLKAISGLIKIGGGSLTLKKGVKIGYMPQRISISPHLPMTVRSFLKLRLSSIDRRILKILKIDDSIIRKDISLVSGGQLQKILFAEAIMSDANILLLDEPEQNLDANTKAAVYSLISSFRTNRGILIVSHDRNIVFGGSDEILYVDKTIHHNCPIQQITNTSLKDIIPKKVSELFGLYVDGKNE